jgi:septal ring factor EnvC (AmiA/AmiB activator)
VLEVQAALEEAEARCSELTSALSASQVALEEARAKLAQQASRLAHLESEFEALQVMAGC